MTNLNRATPSNFNLIFPKVPTSNNIRDMQSLTLNVHTTVLPALTVDTMESFWQGGVVQSEIGRITYEPWLVNFLVDSTFTNWTTIYKWVTFINNNKDKYGRARDEYKIDATLQILDNFRNEIFVIDLYGCWVNMLGEVSLTYREGTQLLESSVNLIYDRYEIRNID